MLLLSHSFLTRAPFLIEVVYLYTVFLIIFKIAFLFTLNIVLEG